MKYTLLLVLFVFLLFAFSPLIAQAIEVQYDYGLPCILQQGCAGKGTLQDYLVRIFQFAFGVAGLLAFGMIVWGGILIGVSGAVDMVNDGKDMIFHSLWGIALLAGAAFILGTVNPQLLNLGKLGSTSTPISGELLTRACTGTTEEIAPGIKERPGENCREQCRPEQLAERCQGNQIQGKVNELRGKTKEKYDCVLCASPEELPKECSAQILKDCVNIRVAPEGGFKIPANPTQLSIPITLFGVTLTYYTVNLEGEDHVVTKGFKFYQYPYYPAGKDPGQFAGCYVYAYKKAGSDGKQETVKFDLPENLRKC